MSPLFDVIRAFLRGLSATYDAFERAGLGWLPWALLMAFAVAFGIWRVRRHLAKVQVKAGDQVLGANTGRDVSGATLWRSAHSADRRPGGLSPFYGRPVALRVVPYPAAVVLLWLAVEARVVFVMLAAGSSVYLVQAVWRSASGLSHRRRVVGPMTKALAPVLGEDPDKILEGIIVPKHAGTDPEARVVIPLPEHHRKAQFPEVARVVSERIGGEWNTDRNDQAPFFLTLSHKPSPPTYVSFEDVADLLVQGDMWHPLIGLGTEREIRRLDFSGQVVHLALAAGTGAGKSTVNRLLLTQLAVHGVPTMIGIDVKGDSFEGSEHIPGFYLFNDIGGIRTLDGIPKMWGAIARVVNELDARRLGKRGPKEGWDPIYLFLEEQNEFAEMSMDYWSTVRDKSDPKTPPVFRDIRTIGFMGRSFGIRMVWAGQDMTADALGGGNMAKGGSLRAQFGNKLLARFQPSQWDKLVGTRPRAQSSDTPGRWVLVQHSGIPLAVQVPDFRPEHSAELLRHAGIELEVSPDAVPVGGARPSHELPRSFGDTGTGDSSRAGADPFDLEDGNVVPFRPRSDGTDSEPVPETRERRYTLEEAVQEGVISVSIDKAKKDRTRARQRGDWYPTPEKRGRAETYALDELHRFYGAPDNSPEQEHERAR